MSELWSVILAGGRGRRLWPWSRSRRPKPCLDVQPDDPLLRKTLERMISDPAHTLVITGEEMVEAVCGVIPEVPRSQILVEPSGRNTAPAIAWATAEVKRRGGELVAIFACDHAVEDVAEFQRMVREAAAVAEEGDSLVLLAQQPDHPSSNYGYLKLGTPVLRDGEEPVYPVEQFVEKPSPSQAQALLDSGDTLWNGGMFVWSVAAFERALQQTLPRTAQAYDKWCEGEPVQDAWFTTDATSIDYGVLERYGSVVALKCDFGWGDLGTWQAVAARLQEGPLGRQRVLHGEAINGGDHVVYAPNHRVLTVGLEGLLVVESGDTLLISRKVAMDDLSTILSDLDESWE